MKQLDPVFKAFLIANNILNNYNNNYDEEFSKNIDMNIKENFIACAFNWIESPEGHDFWEEIDDKWNYVIGDGQYVKFKMQELINEKQFIITVYDVNKNILAEYLSNVIPNTDDFLVLENDEIYKVNKRLFNVKNPNEIIITCKGV